MEFSESEGLPADDETFETRAGASPLSHRPSGGAGQRPLGPPTLSAGHAQVSFISRFRTAANHVHRQSSRMDSSVDNGGVHVIPMDGSVSDDELSSLLSEHDHTQSGAHTPQPPIPHMRVSEPTRAASHIHSWCCAGEGAETAYILQHGYGFCSCGVLTSQHAAHAWLTSYVPHRVPGKGTQGS